MIDRPLLVLAHERHDLVSPVGESESGHSLVEAVGRGRESGDEHRLAVAAERVLEKASELGLAEGDVPGNRVRVVLESLAILRESGDAPAERVQRKVDVREFLKNQKNQKIKQKKKRKEVKRHENNA